MNSRLRFSTTVFRIIAACLVCGVIALPGFFTVSAQVTADGWTTPENLSQSGGTTDPMIVVDSKQVIHVIWDDIYNGYRYVYGDGTSWSTPVSATLPFDRTGGKPTLIPDAKDRILAFWIDHQNNLLYSNVLSGSFSNRGSWIDPITLARNVISYRVKLDLKDNVHITYAVGAETANMPAGIYYQQIQASGNLTKIIPIDQSPYYRRISSTGAPIQDEESPNRISISTDVESITEDSQNIVIVAWTNPTLKRINVRESFDGGNTWEKTNENVGAGNGSTTTPQNIRVKVNQNQIILSWRNGQSSACINYYQVSSDGGKTWGLPAPFLMQVTSCASDDLWIVGMGQLVYLLTTGDSGTYITTWNGNEWSESSLLEISSFANPEAIGSVDLRQRQFATTDRALYVVGSDQSDGEDVWISSEDIESLNPANPTKMVWSRPAVIASMVRGFDTPVILADATNALHVFWGQVDERNPRGPDVSIYHASWQAGDQASQALVLQSPSGKTNQGSMVVDAKGNLLAVWSGGQSGDIYFSSAPSDQANVKTGWYEPVALPSPRAAGEYPAIIAGSNGVISVAYAIPVNEDRGIYVTRSTDNGKTWSDAVKVFDAVINNCEMVDQVNIGETNSGTIHISWRCNTLPGGLGPLSVEYSSSVDGGKAWKPAVVIVERSVSWSKMAFTGGSDLHILWEETSNGQTRLWERISTDDGGSWGNATNIATSDPDQGPLAMTVDPAGQIHLVQINTMTSSDSLQYWKWDGKSWAPGQSRNLEGSGLSQIEAISAAIVPDGHLAVILTGKSDQKNSTGENGLFYLSLPVQIPEQQTATQSTQNPTNTPVHSTPSPTAIETATPQPTLNSALINQSSAISGSSSNQIVMVLGIAAGISLLVIVGAVIYDRRYRHRD